MDGKQLGMFDEPEDEPPVEMEDVVIKKTRYQRRKRVPKARFNGSDYVPARDDERLGNQLERVFEVLRHGEWMTLEELAMRAKAPAASASAQMRHLKKPRFGCWLIEKDYVVDGIYYYRLVDEPEAVRLARATAMRRAKEKPPETGG